MNKQNTQALRHVRGAFLIPKITKGLDDMPPKTLESTKVEFHVMNTEDYAAFEKQTKEAHRSGAMQTFYVQKPLRQSDKRNNRTP